MKSRAYNGVIRSKLVHLQETLAELRRWPLGSVTEFKKNKLHQYAVERALQVCAEVVIDVCQRILALEQAPPAETAAGSVERAAELGVLASAATYADIVRFRNFVVHRYEQVDPLSLYEIATRQLGCFDEFVTEIMRFMELRRGTRHT
jgi:uncharacterized protein YutE (UPF0331/DUF86 family)